MSVKLPRHGCTVAPDGRMIWGWSHGDHTTDFISFPPTICDAQGNFLGVLFSPDHQILDLEQHLQGWEMREILHNHANIRWRKQEDGSWKLRQIVQTDGDEAVEVDHRLQAVIESRRKK